MVHFSSSAHLEVWAKVATANGHEKAAGDQHPPLPGEQKPHSLVST